MTAGPADSSPVSALDSLSRVSYQGLARKVKALVADPFVLQIGAMDGVFFDLLHPVLSEGGWRGILIEPLPDMFALLQKTYAPFPQLKLLNCAIGEHEGRMTLRRVDPEAVVKGLLPKEALGMTTGYADRGFMARDDYAERFAPHMIETDVPCRKVQAVLDDCHTDRIDVVVIDAEGADWMIAQQVDLARYRVRLVCLEFSNLTADEIKECCGHLSAQGFGLALCEEDAENLLFYRE